MPTPAVPRRRPARPGRRVALALLTVTAAPLLLVPGSPLGAAPASAQSLEELRLRELEAAGDLEDSSAQVQAAAAALREVQSRLATARSEVAKARGELAGARARAAAALAEVERAEAARAAAEQRVAEATARVEAGRDDVGKLARRAYQRGRLDDLRQVMESGEPQDAVARAGLLRSVFRFQNASLARLTEDRLALAGTEAELAADQRELDAARARADERASRAREVAERSEAAAARVEDLAAQQSAVLAEAETHRAQDLQDYQAAQAASQALAEQIRAAAARAEAARVAEARRVAALEAQRAAAAAAEAERRRQAAASRQAAPAPARVPAPRAQAAPSATGMVWPAPGRLTSRFGNRTHPIFGGTRFHAGIDIGGGMGARVSAAAAGYVTFAGRASGYGTLVVISHGSPDGRDLSTAYAHMGTITVRAGQMVERGQKVGTIGSEGNSTGPHLHFEVRRNGDPVDPLGFVNPP